MRKVERKPVQDKIASYLKQRGVKVGGFDDLTPRQQRRIRKQLNQQKG